MAVLKKYIRGRGKNKDRYYIYIVINSNSSRTRQSTGVYVSKDYGKPILTKLGQPKIKKGKIQYPKPTAEDFEAYHIGEEYYQRALKRYNKNKHGSVLKDVFNRNVDFLEYFENKIKTKKGQSGYKATLTQLRTFSKNSLPYGLIDLKFLNSFKSYLLKQDSISQNSVNHYLGLFRGILNEARAEGETDINPFEFFKPPKKRNKIKEVLTIEEIKLLSQYQCNTDRQQCSMDAFIFACYTGLRFSDLSSLEWSRIKDGYFIKEQQKTGDDVKGILHPVSQQILNKYKNNGFAKVFELMLTQTANLAFLKKAAIECGISKKVTSHIARHTFNSLIAEFSNDIVSASELSGHGDIRSTMAYLHTNDKRKIKAINSIPSIYDTDNDT